MKKEESFWSPQNQKWIHEGQHRLINEKNNLLVKRIWQYDRLKLKTLIDFSCGIVRVNGSDWLALPFREGGIIYTIDSFGRNMNYYIQGSHPEDTLFDLSSSNKVNCPLFMVQTPMETMLAHQTFNKNLETLGFCDADLPKELSPLQKDLLSYWLKKNKYDSINLFFDCSSDSAYAKAVQLAQDIKKTVGSFSVHLVNITKSTSGTCKNITDCIRNDMKGEDYVSMLKNAEPIEIKIASNPGLTQKTQKGDLKLPESLLDILPPTIKDYLEYCSPLSDVPNEFLVTPFVILLGVLIGKRRYVKIGGIKLFPGAWTVLFAGSSILRKSTALSLAKSLFKPVEEYFIQQYEEQMEEWNREKNQCEAMGKDFEKPVPVRRTLYASDSFSDLTFWEAMYENGSLASVTGEFTALWNELNRPRNGLKDQALRIYDSEDRIRRYTKSGGDYELNNPVWGIAGATTLDNFQRTLTSQERASGLLQRILPVYMEERTKEFRALTELQEPDEELYNRITARILEQTDLEPSQVTLSTGAEELFTQWNYTINEQAEELSKTQSDVGGFVSRLIAHGLKFSMIFQQLEKQKLVISEQNMRAAIGLCDWLFQHILYMLGNNYIFNRVYSERMKLRDIIERQPSGKMSRTELMRQSHFSKEQLDKAIAADLEAGFIKEIKTETNGRPLVEYTLVQSK